MATDRKHSLAIETLFSQQLSPLISKLQVTHLIQLLITEIGICRSTQLAEMVRYSSGTKNLQKKAIPQAPTWCTATQSTE